MTAHLGYLERYCLLWCVREPNVEEYSRGEGWKFVKLATQCHGRQCGFLCCVCRVVWRCEDGAPRATRWRHVISYWAYERCTICTKNVKPATVYCRSGLVTRACNIGGSPKFEFTVSAMCFSQNVNRRYIYCSINFEFFSGFLWGAGTEFH